MVAALFCLLAQILIIVQVLACLQDRTGLDDKLHMTFQNDGSGQISMSSIQNDKAAALLCTSVNGLLNHRSVIGSSISAGSLLNQMNTHSYVLLSSVHGNSLTGISGFTWRSIPLLLISIEGKNNKYYNNWTIGTKYYLIGQSGDFVHIIRRCHAGLLFKEL